jgi:hypothetical protein
MFDIFTALLGIISISVLAGTICKVLLSSPKVWDEMICDEENQMLEQKEVLENYDELRKGNPHIWMD